MQRLTRVAQIAAPSLTSRAFTTTSSSFFRLDGKTAIITGASQSCGEGIAHRLAKAGAKVALFDIQGDGLQRVAKDIGKSAIAVQGDITNSNDIEKAVNQITSKFGGIDIIVNNAGIVGKTVPLWELSQQNLEQVMAVNMTGPFLLCKAVLGRPAKDGEQATGMFLRKYGRIVNVASIAGKEGNPTLIPYSASKAALINFTKALAKEVVGKGDITVNAISPAVIRTKILDTMAPSTVDYMFSKIPMGRTGKIEEVAALVHYLASSESSFCTGQCYDISGGRATY